MAIIIGYVGENGRDKEKVVSSHQEFSGSKASQKKQMIEFASAYVEKKWIKYVMNVDDQKFYG